MIKEDKRDKSLAIFSSGQPKAFTDDEALAPLASRKLRTTENFRMRLRTKLRDHLQALILITLILLFILVFLAPRIFIIIGSGAVGVKYDLRYGTQVDYIYSEGLNIIAPWNRMYIYNARIQETKRTLEVLTRDGLVIKLDISIRYHPEVETIGVLHQEVGPDYVDKIVVPEVESVIRTSVGKMYAEQLYTGSAERQITDAEAGAEGEGSLAETGETALGVILEDHNVTQSPGITARPTPSPTTQSPSPSPSPNLSTALPSKSAVTGKIEETKQDGNLQEVIQDSIRQVSGKYILIDDVIITRAVIPDQIQNAIQAKLEQKELAKAQAYRLAQAKSEFTIKQWESYGNYAIADSLKYAPEILKLKGIEATKELAASPNSKIIVIGNGSGGLPLILNSEK